MQVSNIIVILCGLLLLTGCDSSRKKLLPDEYIGYLQNPDNGLCNKITIKDLTYKFYYQSPELMTLKGNSSNRIDKSDFIKKIKKYDSTIWIRLKISNEASNTDPLKQGISDVLDYQNRIAYYGLSAQRDFTLTYGEDTIKPFAYMFQDSYGITNSIEMTTGYRIPDSCVSKDFTVIFNDNAIGNPSLKFSISKSVITKLPAISF